MWWGTPQGTPAGRDTAPTLGPVPVDLALPGAAEPEPVRAGGSPVAEGLRALFGRAQHCDVVFAVAGECFPAHVAILAAASAVFREFFLAHTRGGVGEGRAETMQGLLTVAPQPGLAAAAGAGAPQPVVPDAGGQLADVGSAPGPAPGGQVHQPRSVLEVQVNGIATAEAVRIVLAYIYTAGTGAPWEYKASSAEVNKDVLRFSRHFGLPQLHEHAARWLVQDLTTDNVVDRLATCDEFGLGLLREKIFEQLTANPAELTVVSSSPELTQHPRILQDLLVQVASLCGAGERPPKKALAPEKAIPGEGPPPEQRPQAKRAKRAVGGA